MAGSTVSKQYKKIKKYYVFTNDVIICNECSAVVWNGHFNEHLKWHEKQTAKYNDVEKQMHLMMRETMKFVPVPVSTLLEEQRKDER